MRADIVKRFEGYWRLEVLNILLIPAATVFFLITTSQNIGWLFWACYLPNVLLLLIGGLYWRAKLAKAKGEGEVLSHFLPWAARGQLPSLILTAAATLLFAASLLGFVRTESGGESIASGFFVFLAIAEYINYYMIQLQHFDNLPDFKRMLAGQGFKKAHMRKDMERAGLR
jgi:hypothetical protein